MKDPVTYLLHLADTSLIMSQRLSEWTGHGPALEQDIALTNIALDYLGQARNWYQYAAECINSAGQYAAFVPNASGPVDEDDLAYLRDERQFRNHLLCELPNGHWGQTIWKLYMLSAWQHPLYQQLSAAPDERVAAIAAKSLKEVQYHLRWSREWVLRLADGTEESRQRMVETLDDIWMFTGELFVRPSYDAGWADYAALEAAWKTEMLATLQEAGLDMPGGATHQRGGLDGIHTEHLGYILAEMQYLQRSMPGLEW